MSKVLGPLFSLDAKGTLKKTIVFQGAIASNKVNKYKKQRDAETERQLLVRTLFDEARQRWNAADSATKAFWNGKARFRNKTGYDLFLQHSINNLRTMDYKKIEQLGAIRFKKGEKPPDEHIDGLYHCLVFGNEEVVLNEEYIFATFHILTDHKPGSDICFALHWFSPTEISGNVKWEFSVVSIESNNSDKVTDTPEVQTLLSAPNPNLGALVKTPDIIFSGSLFGVHDIVGIKVKRLSADAEDTLIGDAHLITVEGCYISDRLGEKV